MSTAGRFAVLSAGLAALFAGAPARAASLGISFTLPTFVQITALNDVVLNIASITTDAVNTQTNCTYSNTLARTYRVTATGSGSGSAFTLSNGNGSNVAYSVGWAGSTAGDPPTNLTVGTPSVTFASAAITPTCAVGVSTSSTLTITIRAADVQRMVAPSAYTGSLTLLVSPI